jgi:hypothetical protein
MAGIPIIRVLVDAVGLRCEGLSLGGKETRLPAVTECLGSTHPLKCMSTAAGHRRMRPELTPVTDVGPRELTAPVLEYYGMLPDAYCVHQGTMMMFGSSCEHMAQVATIFPFVEGQDGDVRKITRQVAHLYGQYFRTPGTSRLPHDHMEIHRSPRGWLVGDAMRNRRLPSLGAPSSRALFGGGANSGGGVRASAGARASHPGRENRADQVPDTLVP